MKKALAFLFCFFVFLSMTYAGSSFAAPASNEPIYLGMINSITGNYANFGVGNQWAANRAVAEINANGGIGGRELVLIFQDDNGNAPNASTLAQKMVDDDRVVGLVGSFTTACSTVIAQVIADKLCQISGSSSSTVYTDTSDWAFSIYGLVATESRFMCRYVVNKFLSNPSVGILYADTDFAHTAYNVFVEQAAKDGVEILQALSYAPTETDFTSVITRMQASNPGTVVIMGTEGSINIINQIRSVGWDVQICSYSKNANYFELTGDNAQNNIVLSRFEFNMEKKPEADFYNDFQKDLGFEPLLQTASSYDAIYMYKQAIEDLMKENKEITRQAVRDKIEKIDYTGLTGRIVFDEGGMVDRGCYIFQAVDGKFVQRTDYSYIDRGY